MGWEAAVKASDGNSYEWYKQDKTNSCGCASILMLMNLIQGKKLDESTVRQWVNEIECGQSATKEGVRDFDAEGAFKEDYAAVLSEKCKIKANTVVERASVRKWITTATPKKPLMAHVSWRGRGATGAHTVVVVNHHGTKTVCLDPAKGLVEIDDDDLVVYEFSQGGEDIRGRIMALTQVT
jgi:ABC-type bacteriocin/lantibiotic exporter with double-glycine peptidase domain